jgi:hypothetical protein
MENEQDAVAAILKSMPPPDVRGDFVARVNARIDEAQSAGWLGLADFRLWTLRLAPAAAALVLVALFWGTPSSSDGGKSVTTAPESAVATPATFSPAASGDWQRDVTGDALIDAALSPQGGSRVR